MVHLKSIWESILGLFGACLGVHFGPSGVHFGSMLRSDSDFGFISPWDQISKALGPILARFSWSLCWPHVGSMLEAVGRLEGSLGVSGPI